MNSISRAFPSQRVIGEGLMSVPPRTWRRTNYASKYRQLVQHLAFDVRYAVALADVSSHGDADPLARALFALGEASNQSLVIIHALIEREFMKNATEPSTILRLNSVASRLMGCFSRRSGVTFLKASIGPLVKNVVEGGVSLEVDPMKLGSVIADEEQLAERQRQLDEIAQSFFDAIVQPSALELMPSEMRALASFIRQSAHAHALDSVMATSLVGGFVMLRFINPAISLPESYNLISSSGPLNPRVRRSLILVTKMLQNLSNNVEFGEKEGFMRPFNSFLKRNEERMASWLASIALPPQNEFQDEVQKTPHVMGPGIDRDEDVGQGIDIEHLFFLHRMIDENADKLVVLIDNQATQRHSTGNDEGFVKLVEILGPAPGLRRKQLEDPKRLMANKVDTLIETRFQNILDHPELYDTSALEKANFLYKGPPDREGRPVFYFIASRLRGEFLRNRDQLLFHVFKVLGADLNDPYCVVVDMSWLAKGMEGKESWYNDLIRLIRMFSRSHRKNLKACYIVHPTSLSRFVLWLLRAFTSEKTKGKIIDIYNWKLLRQYMDDAHIMLPEESKCYIAKAYTVVKVNAKGRRQTRMVKLTVNSILNIDPRTRGIRNEKLLAEIDTIECPPEKADILLIFDMEDHAYPLGYFKGTRSTPEDMRCRRYVCTDTQARDEILCDLVETWAKPVQVHHPQAYQVVKINKYGRKQDRLLKLTKDSLMNIKGSVVTSEIQFVGIETVRLSTLDDHTVLLKCKNERDEHRYVTSQAKALIAAIEEGKARGLREEQKREEAIATRNIDDLLSSLVHRAGRLSRFEGLPTDDRQSPFSTVREEESEDETTDV